MASSTTTSGIVALLLLVGVAHAAPTFLQLRRGMTTAVPDADASPSPAPLWFKQQLLDHFNPQDTRVWSQRYFVNATFWRPGGPVFLQLGGEGAISGAYVTELQYVRYAEEHGALIVALEHRFYGASSPLPDLTTDSLAFLSSMQALEDAVRFRDFMTRTYAGLSPSTPWFTFGCSYAGALASWHRMHYPTASAGAIAGSGPVQATLDFFQYLDTLNSSLAIFGGEQCVDAVANATTEIEAMLATAQGQNDVAAMFNTCTVPTAKLDISTLMNNLMGNWMETVQYNKEIAGSETATGLCDLMAQGPSPLEAYAKINSMFLDQAGEKCLDVSYDNMIAQLRNTTAAVTPVGIRQWTYQTCVEFGYFQTTDSPVQPFGNLVPLSYSLQICKDAFQGLGVDVGAAINITNTRNGGQRPSASSPSLSRVLYEDGTIDPWRPLTVLTPQGDETYVVTVNGTAHCATCNPYRPGVDPAGLQTAYKNVSATLGQWIAASM